MSDIMLTSPHFERVGRTDWWLPRGALVAASELNQKDLDIQLVDLDLLAETDEERIQLIHEIINEERPQRIFLSVHGLFAIARFAYLLDIDKIRNENPGIALIAGGPLPTVDQKYLAKFLDVDQIVKGPVDNSTIDMLIEGIRNKEHLIDLTPISVGMFSYRMDSWLYGEILSQAAKETGPENMNVHLETVRSCPFRCNFCSIPPQYPHLKGKNFGRRSLTDISKELEFLSSFGMVDSIGISDPTFGADWHYTEQTMHLLHKHGFRWSAMSRAEILNPERLRNMKRNGCDSISLGIETPNEETLKKVHKNNTPEKNSRALNAIREEGIAPVGLVILGLTWNDDFSEITEYLYRNHVEQVVATIYHPTPGSPFFIGDMKNTTVNNVRDLEDFDFLGLSVLDWQDGAKLEAQRLAIRLAYRNPYDSLYKPADRLKEILAVEPREFEYAWLEGSLMMRIGRETFLLGAPGEYGEFRAMSLTEPEDTIQFAKDNIRMLKTSVGMRNDSHTHIAQIFGPVQKTAINIREEILSEGKPLDIQKKLRRRANAERPAVRRLLLYPQGSGRIKI